MAAYGLLRALLKDGGNFEQHLRHAITRILLGIAYDYDAQLHNDPMVDLADKVASLTTEGLGTKFFVNILPSCTCQF